MRCPGCQAEIARPGKFCPECAAPLAHDVTRTIAIQRSKPPSSHSNESNGGRFAPGARLGERYQVLGLVGHGGMGEVYRASDIKLNQLVALKFLPPAAAHNARALERFHGEVRIARQVSHPNVCRVYDIGEIDGSAYISMEYVDGEDLGSLLRRIGRLPGDKALEIARRLCAGLAAAHAKGVLHRDLKPGNIMIDGQGQVLIMDFGLAAIADQVEGAEVRNGTPAYMAPEQLSGKEVTERSDIYSLGLVLYEIFTGQRAFKTNDRTTAPSATSIVKDIDPGIERAIARCLDPDPAKRPQSALALARTLPGGDPLAEALAAGDTPSPEMVAASEDTGALSVRAAVVCLVTVIASLVGLLAMSKYSNLLRITPFPYSGDVLAQKARDIAVRVGYTAAPVDQWHTFSYTTGYSDWAERHLTPDEFRKQITAGRPHILLFLYEESQRYLEPANSSALISVKPQSQDPPWIFAGTVAIVMDMQGRLIRLDAVPPQTDRDKPSLDKPVQPMDWNKLFEAAGLDPGHWKPVTPQYVPQFPFDEQRAWAGAYPDAPDLPLRIEAAAWKGRPVAINRVEPWTQPFREAPPSQPAGRWIGVGLFSFVIILGAILAWRNFRSGRSDGQNALRLAAIVFAVSLVQYQLRAHHAPTQEEFGRWVDLTAQALFWAAASWVIYIAVEPYVRRRWPQSLIGWTRLLTGNWRDPLVAGHILLGITAGLLLALADSFRIALSFNRGSITIPNLTTLNGVGVVQALLGNLSLSTLYTLGLLLLLFFFRLLFRRDWAAIAAFAAMSVIITITTMSQPIFVASYALVSSMVIGWILFRFGLVTALLLGFLGAFSSDYPATSDLSAWWAIYGLIPTVLVLALAIWSFRNTLGGRKLWQGDLLDR
jgi:serine/threonine-protein kinase